MKLKTKELKTIEFLGRRIDFYPNFEYEVEDAALFNLLLAEGFIQVGKRAEDIKEISYEKHEQAYMRSKLKEKPLKYLCKIAKGLDIESKSLTKDELIKKLTLKFAEIGSRKEVNKILKGAEQE